MAKNREHSQNYLNMQYSAMRWLAEQGLTPEEIRVFRWGQVDESERVITVRQELVSLRYDRDTRQIYRQSCFRPIRISLKGSGQEDFFIKSKTPSFFWVFTEHFPKGWRREESKEALFPLEVVEKVCKKVQNLNVSALTLLGGCGSIEISKLNIHINESSNIEQIKEGEILVEAND